MAVFVFIVCQAAIAIVNSFILLLEKHFLHSLYEKHEKTIGMRFMTRMQGNDPGLLPETYKLTLTRFSWKEEHPRRWFVRLSEIETSLFRYIVDFSRTCTDKTAFKYIVANTQ